MSECYRLLCCKLSEKEFHREPGPEEVGVQVGALVASFLEVNAGHQVLMPSPVQWMKKGVACYEKQNENNK